MANAGAGRFQSTMAELNLFSQDVQVMVQHGSDGSILAELRSRRLVVPARPGVVPIITGAHVGKKNNGGH